MDRPIDSTRREFLRVAGSTTIAGLIGCISEENTGKQEEYKTNTDKDERIDEDNNGEDDAEVDENTEEEDDKTMGENGDEEGNWATVTISNGTETILAVVKAEIAVTDEERYTGLSDHDSLNEDEGMLFIYGSEEERGFAMRDMNFPIDIIFISANKRITTIYEASVENDQSDLTTYRGQAQWVLEVSRGYAATNEIDEDDHIEIDKH